MKSYKKVIMSGAIMSALAFAPLAFAQATPTPLPPVPAPGTTKSVDGSISEMHAVDGVVDTSNSGVKTDIKADASVNAKGAKTAGYDLKTMKGGITEEAKAANQAKNDAAKAARKAKADAAKAKRAADKAALKAKADAAKAAKQAKIDAKLKAKADAKMKASGDTGTQTPPTIPAAATQ